jgi:RimJ/RimL family protein N-acetyltransferase
MGEAARNFHETFTLRGGSVAIVRAIRPDDRDRLQAAFHALEAESVYLRDFSFKQSLTEADLDRLCGPDFDERVVLVVTLPGEHGEIIVGSGGYVRLPATAAGGIDAAEVAFAVEEDVQGQGISGKLLSVLVGLARDDGITRFDAEVLSRNLPMLRVFERSGLPLTVSPEEDGVVHVRMALAPPAPTAP